MTDRQKLVDQLVQHEGLRLKPYTDTVGKLTIGCGRNLSDKGISSREAFDLLDHDIDEAITDLGTFPWFSGMDPVRQRVLVDMRFQLGATGLRGFRKMLAACGRGDYASAAREMRASQWAQQVPTRAARLIAMMRTGADVLT